MSKDKIMRKFNFFTLLAIVALICFASPALAHDAGSHCNQFGIGHPGCAGDQNDDPAPDELPIYSVEVDLSDLVNKQKQQQQQQQGQQQGQFGIVASENDNSNSYEGAFEGSVSGLSDNYLGVEDNDLSNSYDGEQKQKQKTDVNVDSHDEFTVEGDDVVYEAPEIPVNSAAPVFAGACSQGLSAQTATWGASAGTTNPVCDYVSVAGGFTAAGARTEALRVLAKAEGAADWRYRISQVRSVLFLGIL